MAQCRFLECVTSVKGRSLFSMENFKLLPTVTSRLLHSHGHKGIYWWAWHFPLMLSLFPAFHLGCCWKPEKQKAKYVRKETQPASKYAVRENLWIQATFREFAFSGGSPKWLGMTLPSKPPETDTSLLQLTAVWCLGFGALCRDLALGLRAF